MPDELYNESDLERWQGEMACQESERWGPPTDKRCGTCRWWRRYGETTYCKCPTPWWLSSTVILDCSLTFANDGADCACWEEKDEE